MKRWPSKPLGDVLEVSRERIQPLEYPSTSFNYVGLENVEGHTGKLLPYQPTPGAEIKSTKNVFHPGQILFGKLRPYLNKVHLACEMGICSTDIYVLNPRQHQMDAAFAAYFLRSPVVLVAVSSAMAGANLPRINEESLLEIPAPVPPLAEQERLVKLLDKADELRKLRDQADRRTATLIPALFHEMFGDPDFPKVALRELATKERNSLTNGPFGSDLLSSELTDSGVPVIYIRDISSGNYDRKSKVCVTPGKAAQLEFCNAIPGDVLVAKVGTPPGITAVYPEKEPRAIVTQDVIRIRPNVKLALPVYVEGFLNSSLGLGEVRNITIQATRQRFSLGQFKEIKVPLPPLPLQKEFAACVSEIRAVQAEQTASRRRLDDFFNSLLHSAFQGEL